MKKYLYDYIKEIDNKLKNNKNNKSLKEEHLVKINFFQHERLVHLIVTLSFALLALISILISKYYCGFIFITAILLICLAFYIVHYYYLENGIQYLYKQYDRMNKIEN